MTKRIIPAHIMKRTLTEFLLYPHHEERTETKDFRNSKNELENVEHLGCYKCGSMHKRQSHHIFERAWSNGLDYKKVAYFLYNHFDFHGHCKRDFKSDSELLQFFIDHYNGKIIKGSYQAADEVTGELLINEDGTPKMIDYEYVYCDDDALDTLYNQWIFCENDHVGKFEGVHFIDGAAFMTSLALHSDFHNTLTDKEEKEWKEKHRTN